jgi:hypothetical protein
MPRYPFVPDDFQVPAEINCPKYIIRLLNMSDLAKDYDAYMRDMERIQKAFNPNETLWPTKDVTIRLALADLGFCEWEHYTRSSFSYGVFDLENKTALGSIYVHQTGKAGYDAQMYVWVRESESETGLEEELFQFARGWLKHDWPFKKVAYPGRVDSWDDCSHPNFLPREFEIPQTTKFDGFHMRLMNMDDMIMDYDTCMANREHLYGVFGPNGLDWPRTDLTPQLALADLGYCEWEHFQRSSFSYCVMSPDESQQLGCVYVNPTQHPDYDAEVYMWVTSELHAKGFDSALYEIVTKWILDTWPFKNVAYPGRKIAWQEWDAA